MPRQDSTPLEEVVSRAGIVVLSGYGVRVAVERGHLVVADGIGRERRQGRFSRATSKIKRLVVLGHSGTISFEALRWLYDIGAAFIQIDGDGNVVAASAPAGLDDARLRRAQALATTNGVGIVIARQLLEQKLRKQAQVLEKLAEAGEARMLVLAAVDEFARAETVEQLRVVEAAGASAYWGMWASVPVIFGKRDQQRVPEHWKTFGVRRSPLSGSPRSAANPANALFNYCYAMLEAEASIAARTVGLDPGMGVLHADLRSRDSLACDLMEAVRPDVDAAVLNMLQTRTFSIKDFFENRQGVCRLLSPTTHLLAEMGPNWTKLVAPIAEHVAQQLHESRQTIDLATLMQTRQLEPVDQRESIGKVGRLSTPLTQANRRAGRDRVRRNPARSVPAQSAVLPPACRGCGVLLENLDRLYCDECLPERQAESIASFSVAGPEALSRLRAEGTDPAHGGDAGRKRGERNAQHERERAVWEREHGSSQDPAYFVGEVLPQLQAIPLSTIMRATGFSLRYCSLIRRGQRVPHPRHWQALEFLCGAAGAGHEG